MKSYEERIDDLVTRAIEKKQMPLYDLIMTENLQEYTPGTLTILNGDELSNAIVPCEGFMILVRDRYDETCNGWIAEYAIYSEHDNDNHNLRNALNYNAVYRLEYVGEETFRNMASAIAYAADLIEKYNPKGEN